jgi:molybdate/tungstate transport system substrate-binding protein
MDVTKPEYTPRHLSGTLTVLHAGSLKKLIAEVNREFVRLNPDVNISTESGGSAGLVRDIVDHRRSGVLASADYRLIPELMIPSVADWYVIFASNQIALCYTDRSRYRDSISTANWHQVLQKSDVRFGRSDPDQDPAGYRTLLVWKLAEAYYGVRGLFERLKESPGNTVRQRADDLVSLLKSGSLDYAFEYDSVARQNDLKYVSLPDQINLSNKAFEDFYARASVRVKGTTPGETLEIKGEPILYAVTIPKSCPNMTAALAWVRFLISDAAHSIVRSSGFIPVGPTLAGDVGKVPDVLRRASESAA